eukprot:18923-Eustigmatos_ZCMA.PRE.1
MCVPTAARASGITVVSFVLSCILNLRPGHATLERQAAGAIRVIVWCAQGAIEFSGPSISDAHADQVGGAAADQVHPQDP